MVVRFEKQPLRAAVLFSGGGSTLANFIDCIATGRLRGIRIVTTVSSRSAVRGVEIAAQAGLPVSVVRTRDYPDVVDFSRQIASVIESAACDLVLMAGFMCFWDFPRPFAGRVLNIHPSLLPRFGGKGMYGPHVHAAVLAAGERVSGCTVHIVDHEYDHGPIIAQQEVPVGPEDTAETLGARVGAAERELYPRVVQSIVDSRGAVLDPILERNRPSR